MKLRARFGAALIAVLASASAGTAGTADAAVRHTALIYGDSIAWESFSTVVAHAGTWTMVNEAAVGTAPCDWLPGLAAELATRRPDVVALETVGNASRPCMGGVSRPSPEYYARDQADLTTFVATVRAAGVRFVFVQGPPMKDPTWNSAVTGLIAIEKQIAATYGVKVNGAARAAVSVGGKYADYKPCLRGELTNVQCVGGLIAVRTLAGTQAGIHLCPDGLNAAAPYQCDEYSSGELRFGRALAAAAKGA